MKKDFAALEEMCRFCFLETGNCFHVCSQENHPVLFHDEEMFKAAMNIVAFCALLFPDIRIFTFELMSNHFHFAISGDEDRIRLFCRTLVSRLSSHPLLRSNDIKNLTFRLYPIADLDNLRNVIAYINRNGAVIDPDESVYTYKWGANRYFFNEEALLRFRSCGRKPSFREKREMFHSDLLGGDKNIILVDGYVSPLCYCYITKAESFFRNNRHYFFSVSRNIEASAAIAKTIGENIFYSDDDLFVHIVAACSKRYGCRSVATLDKGAKIELAKELHFDFNAGNKQISRLLKIDMAVLSSLFP